MEVLLRTVLPVALIVGLGYLAGRRLEPDLGTLSRLAVHLLVPFLIFDAMLKTTLPGASALGLALAFFLASGGLAFLALGLALGLRLERGLGKTLLAAATFPNSGNMGLPLVYFALGEAGLERGVVYFVASSFLMFGLGPALLRGGGVLRALTFTLRLPLFWALALGLALRGLGLGLPQPLENGVGLLAQAAIPLMLLALGIQMAQSPLGLGGFELLASLLRLLGGPGVAWLAGKALGLPTLDLQVLVLQSATPVAVNAFLMAGLFGGDAPRAARAVVVSTLLAFLTLPLALLILGV